MGRSNQLPLDIPRLTPFKLHLAKVPFVDGDYDQGGAYWGGPADLYCAYGALGVPCYNNGEKGFLAGSPAFDECLVFVRAKNRADAKTKVRNFLPNVRFTPC